MNDGCGSAGLSLSDVVFSYHKGGGHPALSGFSACFASGELTLVTGPSGCGKSTMLYLAAGIYPKYAGGLVSGAVSLGVSGVANMPPEIRATHIGMMFQNPDLQFCMDTVESELVFCLENIAVPRSDIDSRIADALVFCDVGHLRTRRLDTLSGGEKQKVALACLVALDARWLLLDEPFANIDTDSAFELAARLGRLVDERGKSVVAVDHKLDVWLGVAHSIVVLAPDGGSVTTGIRPHSAEMDSLPERGVDIPSEPYLANGFAARPPAGSAVASQAVSADAGREAATQGISDAPPTDIKSPAIATPAPAALLRLADVRVEVGGSHIVSGLSATMGAGRLHAILGASGSGKSTLLEAVCGFRPYEGSILVAGDEVRRIPKKRLGRTVGFVFQNPQDQFVAATVLDEVLTGMKARADLADQAARLAEAECVLREARLWRYRQLSPYMLSQGEQRRLALVALLAYRCRLLVCDEPTYAQDLRSLRAVMDMLVGLVESEGLTLLISTHDKKLARDYAHHTWHLDGGILCEA